MKKRTLMKRVCVFAMLCVLTITMFVEPSFAGTYEIDDGGRKTTISGPRATACDKMTTMSQMEWTLPETLYYCTRQSGGALTIESGVKLYKYKNGKSAQGVITRKGIPYSQVDREYSFPSGVFTLNFGTKTLVVKDGDKTKTYRSVKGTDCASSVAFAWRKGTGNNSASSSFLKRSTSNAIYTTENMFNDAMDKGDKVGTGDYLKIVGNYGSYDKTTATTTKKVVTALMNNNYDIYSEVYAKIKPGDALLYRTTSGNGSGHVRLVTNVKIVYNGKAVDPTQSYVQCIEQTGFSKSNSNWSSSWIPNDEKVPAGSVYAGDKFTGRYTFEQLAGVKVSPTVNSGDKDNCYLPIRLKDWN